MNWVWHPYLSACTIHSRNCIETLMVESHIEASRRMLLTKRDKISKASHCNQSEMSANWPSLTLCAISGLEFSNMEIGKRIEGLNCYCRRGAYVCIEHLFLLLFQDEIFTLSQRDKNQRDKNQIPLTLSTIFVPIWVFWSHLFYPHWWCSSRHLEYYCIWEAKNANTMLKHFFLKIMCKSPTHYRNKNKMLPTIRWKSKYLEQNWLMALMFLLFGINSWFQ